MCSFAYLHASASTCEAARVGTRVLVLHPTKETATVFFGHVRWFFYLLLRVVRKGSRPFIRLLVISTSCVIVPKFLYDWTPSASARCSVTTRLTTDTTNCFAHCALLSRSTSMWVVSFHPGLLRRNYLCMGIPLQGLVRLFSVPKRDNLFNRLAVIQGLGIVIKRYPMPLVMILPYSQTDGIKFIAMRIKPQDQDPIITWTIFLTAPELHLVHRRNSQQWLVCSPNTILWSRSARKEFSPLDKSQPIPFRYMGREPRVVRPWDMVRPLGLLLLFGDLDMYAGYLRAFNFIKLNILVHHEDSGQHHSISRLVLFSGVCRCSCSLSFCRDPYSKLLQQPGCFNEWFYRQFRRYRQL